MIGTKRYTLFLTLVSLTFIIFLSSAFLQEVLLIEEKVEAKTIESAAEKSNIRKHSTKIINITYKEIHEFKTTDPHLYLTFDDGPTKHTEPILDILNQNRIKSTFFMLQGNIYKFPEVVKSVKKGRHSLACHGVTHRVDQFYANDIAPVEEMDLCNEAIQKVVGEKISLIRVPFGSFPHLTLKQKTNLDGSGYIMWDWNVDSMDWGHKNQSPDQLVNTVIKQVTDLKEKNIVPVILLHDTEITVKALPTMITKLSEMGYSFRAITTKDEPLQFKIKN